MVAVSKAALLILMAFVITGCAGFQFKSLKPHPLNGTFERLEPCYSAFAKESTSAFINGLKGASVVNKRLNFGPSAAPAQPVAPTQTVATQPAAPTQTVAPTQPVATQPVASQTVVASTPVKSDPVTSRESLGS